MALESPSRKLSRKLSGRLPFFKTIGAGGFNPCEINSNGYLGFNPGQTNQLRFFNANSAGAFNP
jgi:hypothetical protein